MKSVEIVLRRRKERRENDRGMYLTKTYMCTYINIIMYIPVQLLYAKQIKNVKQRIAISSKIILLKNIAEIMAVIKFSFKSILWKEIHILK
jgi:hypothetical protein